MAIQRSWWNRITPTRIRQNLSLILGSAFVLILASVFLGSFPLQPIVFSNGSSTLTSEIINNIEGEIDLFDGSQPHSITFEMDELEYEFMQSEFIEFGEKAWVQVRAVIDGTVMESVGVRLKGNSTLGPLGGGGDAFSVEKVLGDDFDMPEGMENGIMASDVSFDDPSTLPLLVSFNEFVPGRGYQGHTSLALRFGDPGLANLNEGLALQLIADSDQVSQDYTWVSYSINDSKTTTRILIENPSQDYITNLDIGPGVMYKSRNSNTFTYHGDDQTQYLEDFLQLNALGSQDLTPIIRFIKWIESSTDEEFDAELADWLDIPSFAKYVVTHDLLNNFDDMAGPGKNFLLWYDLTVKKFTVMTWDVNMAISGMQGDFLPEGMNMIDVMKAISRGEIDFETLVTGGLAGGMPEAPVGADMANMPEGALPPGFPTPPEGVDMAAMMAGGEGGMPPGMAGGGLPEGISFGNTLKDRFTESEVFAEIIAATREELLDFWFTSGLAQDRLEELYQYAPVTDKISREQLQAEMASLTEKIAEVK